STFLYDGTNISTLAVPGASQTTATAVSGNNIAGLYWDGAGQHVFVKSGSTYNTLNVPGGTSPPQVTGISGNTIVGYYNGAGGSQVGYAYDGTTLKTLMFPGALGTTVYGSSGSLIVGAYSDGKAGHSFIYDGSNYSSFNLPGADSFFFT